MARRAALARAIAYQDDAPVRVIGPDKLVGGDATIMEAVTSGLLFMVQVDVDVLAIDCDSEHLRPEGDRIAGTLRRAGELPVLVASGRVGHVHLFGRVRNGRSVRGASSASQAGRAPVRRKPMGRYRKIDPRIWNDEKFRRLSDRGKLAFLLVLTHPTMTALGAMRGTLAGLAAELGLRLKTFRTALMEAVDQGMLVLDEGACFISLPKFLRYNEPEGPNSVSKAWIEALDLIPECEAKKQLIIKCRAYLEGKSPQFLRVVLDANGDAIRDAFGLTSHIQEQEPQQEQEQNKCSVPSERHSPASPSSAAAAQPLLTPKTAASTQHTAKEYIWSVGLSLLLEAGGKEDSSRNFLGRLAARCGDDQLATVIARAVTERPQHPRSWIAARLTTTPGGQDVRVHRARLRPDSADPEKWRLEAERDRQRQIKLLGKPIG